MLLMKEREEREFAYMEPDFQYYVWDGRLYKEEGGIFRQYMEPYTAGRNNINLLVTKWGSETLVHTKKTDQHLRYTLRRIMQETGEAKKRGVGCIVVFSGVCKLGRKARIMKKDAISENLLKEMIRDAEYGKSAMENYIKTAGSEKIYIKYVTPPQFKKTKERRGFAEFCLHLINDGHTIWLNEDDMCREQLDYGPGTFNENDTLAAMVAIEMNGLDELNAHVGLSYHMDQMGILPRLEVEERDKIISSNKGKFSSGEGDDKVDSLFDMEGGFGFKDLRAIIAVVKNPEHIGTQAVTNGDVGSRITRGGLSKKIEAAIMASKNGVPTWIGPGMFVRFDGKHMKGKIPYVRFTPIKNVLDGSLCATHFLPNWHPSYPKNL